MKKLLIVDDEIIVRIGIRSILNWEEYGYTIIADASNGEEALGKIREFSPDIVLADLKMENMDGFELIKRCAKEYPNIIFIVLSSHNEFEDVRNAMKLGAKDYLFKPTLSRDELLKVLDEVSDKSLPGEEPRREALDTVIRENLEAIRFNLLWNWVNRPVMAGAVKEDDILAQFRTLAPKVNLEKPFRILFVSIQEYEKQIIQGGVHLLKSSMENTINQIIKTERAEVFNYEKGGIVVFFNLDESNNDASGSGILQAIEEVFQKIREYCRRYLGLDVSGTISPEASVEKIPGIITTCQDTLSLSVGGAGLLPYNHGQRNEIAKAKQFIMRHLGERIGVQETASAAGMSESYFSHLFKKETGLNVIDYITRLKMERAAELLENPGIKIAEVAAQIGVDNANYFSVIFKKVMGLSPHEYRKKRLR